MLALGLYILYLIVVPAAQDDRVDLDRKAGRRGGIIAVNLDEGDYLIGAALTDGRHDVMLFSDGGKAVRFHEEDVRPLGRSARGVRFKVHFSAWNFSVSASVNSSSFFMRNDMGPSNMRLLTQLSMWKTSIFWFTKRPTNAWKFGAAEARSWSDFYWEDSLSLILPDLAFGAMQKAAAYVE